MGAVESVPSSPVVAGMVSVPSPSPVDVIWSSSPLFGGCARMGIGDVGTGASSNVIVDGRPFSPTRRSGVCGRGDGEDLKRLAVAVAVRADACSPMCQERTPRVQKWRVRRLAMTRAQAGARTAVRMSRHPTLTASSESVVAGVVGCRRRFVLGHHHLDALAPSPPMRLVVTVALFILPSAKPGPALACRSARIVSALCTPTSGSGGPCS